MIDYDILDSYESSDLRLRAVFTAEDGSELHAEGKLFADWVDKTRREKDPTAEPIDREELSKELCLHRKQWEDKIQARTEEGRIFGLRNYRLNMAADLAYEKSPLTPAQFPLQMYANGRLDLSECVSEVAKAVGETNARKFFVYDENDKKKGPIAIREDRLIDASLNLVRPYLRRSVAALVDRYSSLSPFLKYDSRSKTMVGELRADVLSERIDIQTDQFGYRDLFEQMCRQMYLHTTSFAFVETSWACEKSILKKSDGAGGWKPYEKIQREGTIFATPHPTRRFHDPQYSLSTINNDGGCGYLGYWDIVTYRSIKNNPDYFNRNKIPFSASPNQYYTTYKPYFDYYYATTLKNITALNSVSEENRRDANTGVFSGYKDDEALWLTHYYEKVVPNQCGLGNYPHPVWVHLIVASDMTVVYAEFLPSRPGFAFSYDENQQRMTNISMALDIIPYQDEVSNMFNQMLYLMRIQSLMFLALDSDVVPKNIREEVRKVMETGALFSRVHYLETSAKIDDVLEQTIQQKKPMHIFQADVANIIGDLMKGIATITTMLERNQMMSPNEMGQFVERETSATEVQAVNSTSNSLFSYKSVGVDRGRQGQKVILYESLIACGSKKISVTVPERYPDDVIEAAGFTLETGPEGYTLRDRDRQTIIGTIDQLIHEYTFTSRDGAERAISSERAKNILEFLRYIFSSADMFQLFERAFGMEQITMMLSQALSLSGAGMVLKLPNEFSEKEFRDNLQNRDLDAARQQIEPLIRELDTQIQQMNQRLTEVENVAQDYIEREEASSSPSAPAVNAAAPAQQPQQPPQPAAMMMPAR